MSDDYIWDLRRICKSMGHVPKPCPFCGKEAQLEYVHAPFVTFKTSETKYLGIYTTVQCTDAFCGCRIGNYEDPIMAINAWNKRAGNKIKPKTGHWIEHEWAEEVGEYLISNYECSECHTWKREASGFCPDCGIKMKGVVKKEE